LAKGEIFVSGNLLIIFGGGLIDCGKQVILRLARNLSKSSCFKTIYIGQYSFESFYTPELLRVYNDDLKENVKNARGTIFGTCRDINLSDPILFKESIKCLKEHNIFNIIVVGGDGSSRQVAEISEALEENGINIVFAVPLTIDGINGGASIGLNQASRESIRQIENIVSTSLQTRDAGKFGVVMVELQGINRDDILASVLLHFLKEQKIADNNLSDILLRVVPATIKSDYKKLVEEVNSSSKPTLILVSEGAKVKISTLKKLIDRKVRTVVVGHASQSNNSTTEEDLEEYDKWLDQVSGIIENDINNSFCLVNHNGKIWKVPIDYYAIHNPRKKQKAELDTFCKYCINTYIAK
jgi:6-phosphofructokinase